MDSTELNEVTLTDEQLAEGCVKHVLHVTSTDQDTVSLTLDDSAPVSFTTKNLVAAQDLYDVFQFSAGAKYELIGQDSYGHMDMSVYRDFYALILEIVNGLNGLNPGPIERLEGQDYEGDK